MRQEGENQGKDDEEKGGTFHVVDVRAGYEAGGRGGVIVGSEFGRIL
jgi:hypothetical protein